MRLPPYTTFPTISNDKILLRQIEFSDSNDIVEISFYNAIQAKTLEQAIAMQANINKDYMAGTSIHWGFVGTCGY